jgi:propionyl-CoA synthetase
VPVLDHYWQTETGWAMLSYLPGVELKPNRFGSPGFPAYGFNIRIVNDLTGEDCGPNEKGVLTVVPPLPPGCLTTVWGDDKRFINSYFGQFEKELLYSSSDWAVRDADGYTFILGRTDDVINTAGHRLGTREIEEALQAHPAIAEVAVVGLHDELKGQVPVGFCTVKDPTLIADADGRAALEKSCIAKVAELLGAVAKPYKLHFVRVAEDPFRQAAAAFDPGAGGRPRNRRSVDAGRSECAGGNPQGGRQVTQDAIRWAGAGLPAIFHFRHSRASPLLRLPVSQQPHDLRHA